MRLPALVLPLAAVLAGFPALAAPAPAPSKPAPVLAAPTVDVGVQPANVSFEQQVILPPDGPYLLSLKNVRGRVVLKRWNKNVIWAMATVRASRPIAGTELEFFRAAGMQVQRPTADGVAIETIFRGVRDSFPAVVAAKASHVEVDYIVAVPPETAVELRQENGAVVASGLDGRLDLFTRDGDVSVYGCKGWVDAGNERGRVRIADIQGDAVGRSFHGYVSFQGVSGDVRAITSTGPVHVDVPPRWVGDVSAHTVSGTFRSDLATFGTDLEPGDTGYVGTLRGPLANIKDEPLLRVRVDTTSGDVAIAAEQPGLR